MAIAGTAVMRAADAMLRALGGDEIALLLPLSAGSGGQNVELGLNGPGMQQLTISPAVVRSLSVAGSGPRRRREFLLSASAVANAVDDAGLSSADELFDSALGIQYQADLLHIESAATERFAGTAYLYRVVAVE
jgi:hypothetical protein